MKEFISSLKEITCWILTKESFRHQGNYTLDPQVRILVVPRSHDMLDCHLGILVVPRGDYVLDPHIEILGSPQRDYMLDPHV